jgi:hypothetical protein
MSELSDPDTGKKIISGSRGKTTTLLCKVGESADECAERHRDNGWDVPPGYKLGTHTNGDPVLEW